MAFELFPTAGGFNEINLANYIPNHRSYNFVEYVHKRCLIDGKDCNKRETKNQNKKKKAKEKKNLKHDKCQQFNSDDLIHNNFNKKEPINCKFINDPVMNQTIRFAKKLVPETIPPNDSSSPVFYTIKTKKYKKKKSRNPEDGNIQPDLTYEKDKKFQKTEYIRKKKVINHTGSLKESVTHSLQNTLDEININETLSYTISEMSDAKQHRRREEINKIKSNNKSNKFVISNSFEAFATESMDLYDGKIKIHLMNDTDKKSFTENVSIPIINAIKDCIYELNNCNNTNMELQTVQRFIKCNNEKLDNVLDKITCIEQKIDNPAKKVISIKSPKIHTVKASTLEQLGQDLADVNEGTSSNESKEKNIRRKQNVAGKSVIVSVNLNKEIEDKSNGSLVCGEIPELNGKSVFGQLGIKPDHTNRIPTRFYWTEAGKRNLN